MKTEYKINIVNNKSRTYFLPLVDEQVNFKFDESMLNTYLSCEEGDDIFCVMYRWSSDPEFLRFEGEMMKNHLYVGHSDYGDRVVYKFRLSRLMKIEREKFIKGEYTLFSEENKDLIYHRLIKIGASNHLRIAQILSADEPLSSTPPLMENEILSNHVKTLNFKIESFTD